MINIFPFTLNNLIKSITETENYAYNIKENKYYNLSGKLHKQQLAKVFRR